MSESCVQCGARLEPDAAQCPLCGTRVNEVAEPLEEREETTGPVTDGTVGPFCTACGTKNPENARFCFSCGTQMVNTASPAQSAKVAEGGVSPAGSRLPPPSSPQAPKEPETGSVGKQVGIVMVAAILVVVSLFVITNISNQNDAGGNQPGDPATFISDGPLPEQFAAREEELRAELAEGPSVQEQERIRRSLVDVYLSAARLDLAGQETREVATLTGAERDWIASGNMFYDWMETKPVAERAPWAVQAIASYREALALNPDNNDVRTDMAIAYMYDPQNPMLAIQETNAVLERDSLHVQANFNRGIMLMQINRLDQAREQFERVKTLVGDPDNPVYARAEEALARLDAPGQ